MKTQKTAYALFVALTVSLFSLSVTAAQSADQADESVKVNVDKFTAVGKPNVDTYYSFIWYNFKAEPLV